MKKLEKWSDNTPKKVSTGEKNLPTTHENLLPEELKSVLSQIWFPNVDKLEQMIQKNLYETFSEEGLQTFSEETYNDILRYLQRDLSEDEKENLKSYVEYLHRNPLLVLWLFNAWLGVPVSFILLIFTGVINFLIDHIFKFRLDKHYEEILAYIVLYWSNLIYTSEFPLKYFKQKRLTKEWVENFIRERLEQYKLLSDPNLKDGDIEIIEQKRKIEKLLEKEMKNSRKLTFSNFKKALMQILNDTKGNFTKKE